MKILEDTIKLLSRVKEYFQHQFNWNKNKRKINNVFTLLILIALGIYLYQNQDSFSRLKDYSFFDILIIFFLHLVSMFVLGLFNFVVFKRIDPRVRFSDSLLLQYVNNFFNNILSKGGNVYRAVYLKTIYEFPYSKFISSLAGLYVITFLTGSMIGLISILIIFKRYHQQDLIITLIFLGVFTGSLIIALITPHRLKGENHISKVINSFLVGWKNIKENQIDIISLVTLSSLNIYLKTVQFIFVYRELGMITSWEKMFYLSALASVMQIINITPSGIGIREAIFAFSSNVLLIPGNILVLGSLVIRLISIPASIIAGLISYSVLQKRINRFRKPGQMTGETNEIS